MPPPSDLASIFRAHVKAGLALPEAEVLEPLLRRACETAIARWPDVALSAEEYVRHLARKLQGIRRGETVEQTLRRAHHDQLYLACACVEEVPEAVKLFEQEFMAKLPGLLTSLPYDLVQDTCQKLREFLLIRPAGGSPGIDGYGGRGTLMNWLRVSAVRDTVRRSGLKHMLPMDAVPALVEKLPAPGTSPELELIRRDMQEAFEPCLRAALATLADDEYVLLRLHFEGGLSTVAIAAFYGVAQPTISRHLQSVRQKMLEATGRCLKERLKLTSGELESYLAAMGSQLDISMSKIFEDEDSSPAEGPDQDA